VWESLRKQYESGSGLLPGLERIQGNMAAARALVEAATNSLA
jgi:hypothetical protein